MSIFRGITQWLKADKPINTVDLVPRRFIQLFQQHGIEASQIPRIFPKISLDDLKSHESLIKKLTPELLDEVSKLFVVSSQWLEGIGDEIYEHHSCYKRPELFFKLLNQIKFDGDDYPIRILTSAEHLDFKSNAQQPILLIALEKIAFLGEEDIYRYYIDTQWDWGHYPCRIQLKAIARVFYKAVHTPIPIFKVTFETLEAVADLKVVPTEQLNGCLSTNPSLEDFALWPEESAVAQDKEEMLEVLDYIKDHQLDGLLRYKNSDEYTAQSSSGSSKLKPQDKARKAAYIKSQPGNDLKRRFIEIYADKVRAKSISANKAAKEFYYAIPENQEKLLFRSEKDYLRLSAQEQEANAKRTLTNAISKHLKTAI